MPELADLLPGAFPVSAVDEFDHELQHAGGDGTEPRTSIRELAVHPAHRLLVTRRVGFEAASQFGKGANAGQLGIHPANDRVQPVP